MGHASPPRRALVTGGAGFLGSHLCDRLLSDGWAVECVDNLSTGATENVAEAMQHPSFEFHRADVSRGPLRERSNAGRRLDAVFHLACPASPVQYHRLPLETLEVCSNGTRAALELAREQGAAFFLSSTSEVYGDPLVHPQTEDYWGNVDPIGPRSMYDEGKRFAEALATWYARVHGVDVRIVRIFNTYGPRMDLWDGRVVPTFIRQALTGEPLTVHGEGEQTRSFCYVADLVEGIVKVATADRDMVDPYPFNLGNPDEITMRQLAATLLGITGSSSSVRSVDRPAGDPERRRPDTTRVWRTFGWEPKVGLEEGLRATVAWARSL